MARWPRMSRRRWLASGALVLGGAGAVPLSDRLGHWLGTEAPRYVAGPFGRVRPDPEGRFDLLEGFSYRVLDRSGRRMTDGRAVPRRPDGMACFEGEPGTLVLMRNHELPSGVAGRLLGGDEPPPEAYSRDAHGGVTRVVLDAETLEARSSNLVLAGTSMNCSGGASPWGWLSCEEAVEGLHGFVFSCDPSADAVRPPERIDGYGRFRHESAAVHPETYAVYLSEDRPDGCLYRFVPHDPSSPFEGALSAMRVRGRPDTASLRRGDHREIEWVELAHPTPERDELRHEAQRLGAARVKRGEGVSIAGGAVYVCATSGGPVGAGQIFRIEDGPDGGTLDVVAASTDRDVLDMPDNVTMGPRGTLFFVEDGPGHDYVRGVLPDGRVFDFGRNAGSESELAGVCFSPDGRAMFLNIQEDGLTLAVEGPFASLAA